MKIGEKIKIARKRAGMTQEQLGQKIGVTGVAVMRYERGERQPKVETLLSIAHHLNVPITDFINFDESAAMMALDRSYVAVPNDMLDDVFSVVETFQVTKKAARKRIVEYAKEIEQIPKYRKTGPDDTD